MEEIFTDHLPWVNKKRRDAFCKGMQAYFELFNTFRMECMNYEDGSDYQNGICNIVELYEDECWVYAPQFNCMMARMLGALFKTEIVSVSVISPVRRDAAISFHDVKGNRWTMTRDVRDKQRVQLGFWFPKKLSAKLVGAVFISNEKDIYEPSYVSSILVVKL